MTIPGRKPLYISPSALKKFSEDQENYYLEYLCADKPTRFPQTKPMSIGSAFDAYVKADMHAKIFGPNHPKAAMYDLRAIFEAQVEEHNRQWAWVQGEYVFQQYKKCGALADLMFEIDKASTEPQFEVEIKGEIEGIREGLSTTQNGVVLFGKPDVFFMNSQACHVTTDWKVNGYCSRSPVSPMAGYRVIRYCDGAKGKNAGQSHKDYIPIMHKGTEINGGSFLESYNKDWAIQLATYGWLHGGAVGVEEITAIDQIVCDARCADYDFVKPALKVASHRTRVSSAFQKLVIAEYTDLWYRIYSDPFHFFTHLSLDESQAKCLGIQEMAKRLWGAGVERTDNEDFMAQCARGM